MLYLGLDPRFDVEHLGFLPGFLSEDDPRPAKEQYDANYAHGGGFRPMSGWKWDGMAAYYPGDPPYVPFAMTMLREEKILFFPYALVMILQPDGSFEMARMD